MHQILQQMTKVKANTILVAKPRFHEAGSHMKAGKKALGRLSLLPGLPRGSILWKEERSHWSSHAPHILPQPTSPRLSAHSSQLP